MRDELGTAIYIAILEEAVLKAEWWLADPAVAARKDRDGERVRAVFAAADAVRSWRAQRLKSEKR